MEKVSKTKKTIINDLSDSKTYVLVAEYVLANFQGVTLTDCHKMEIPSLLNGITLIFSWNETKVYIDFGDTENINWKSIYHKSWRYFDEKFVIEVLEGMKTLEKLMRKNEG